MIALILTVAPRLTGLTMLRKILDHWLTYVVATLLILASGVHSYLQLVAYEAGERVVMSGRLFWLYRHCGKGADVALTLLLAALFIWAAWFKYRNRQQ